MCYPGMKGPFYFLFSLHGGGAGYGRLSGHTPHNKMRRRRRLGGGGGEGQLFWIQSIKTARTNREEVFPQRTCCSVLCSYPEHVASHGRDQQTHSSHSDAKIATFEKNDIKAVQ